jgi:hypothetical protein
MLSFLNVTQTIPTRQPVRGGRFEELRRMEISGKSLELEKADRTARGGPSVNMRPTAEQKNLVDFSQRTGADKKRPPNPWKRSFRDQKRWGDDSSLSRICEFDFERGPRSDLSFLRAASP